MVGFGPGHPHVGFRQENVAPSEVENFSGANERPEGEGKEAVVFDLEGRESTFEGQQMLHRDPERWFLQLVYTAIGLESEGGEWWQIVDFAPEYDRRGRVVCFSIGVAMLETVKDEFVEGGVG